MNFGFQHLTPEELRAASGAAAGPFKLSSPSYMQRRVGVEYPKTLDYRNFQVGKTFFSKENLVMPVQNQGKCGSCYLYAAIGQLASFLSLHYKVPIYINPAPFLSNAVSSTPLVEDAYAAYGCPPCSGGNSFRILDNIFKQVRNGNVYFVTNPDIRHMPIATLPADLECSGSECYTDDRRRACLAVWNTSVPVSLADLFSPAAGTAIPEIQMPRFTHVGLLTFPSCLHDAENMLMNVLNIHGPVAMSIYMTAKSFVALNAPYIYTESMVPSSANDLSGYSQNHEVLCIGYKTLGSKQVWIIQNCWGRRWGDAGFFYLPRGMSQPHDLGGWSISQWQQWPKGPGNIFGTDFVNPLGAQVTSNNTLSVIYTADANARSCPSADGYFKNSFSRPPDCTCADGYSPPECKTCVNSEMDPAEGCTYCKKGQGFQPSDCKVCRAGFKGKNCTECVNGLLQFPFCNISCPKFPNKAPPMCEGCLGKWTGSSCDSCPPKYDPATCSVCKNPRFDATHDCNRCIDPNSDFSTGCEKCLNQRMVPSLAAADRCDCKIPFAMKIQEQCACKPEFTGAMCTQCVNGNTFPNC